MFSPSAAPRVFALPPGADFAREMIAGLSARSEDLSRTRIFVNTSRMQRRLRAIFDAGPPRLLPRIHLVTDLALEGALAGIPAPVSSLRRRLELTQLVAAFLEKTPDLPRAALYDLSDSLASLMDEMHGEGVPPERLAQIDVSDASGHWQRALAFLNIVQPFFDVADRLPDVQARQRMVIEALIDRWGTSPPQDPLIVAGSTGSRGATGLLMQAVSKLPQGAVILPGFDFDLPKTVWDRMDDQMKFEDHPQYRFHTLMQALGLSQVDVQPWTQTQAPTPARNRLISLSLRPAPVTDQWRIEGRNLGNLVHATQHLTLVEAATPRAEAEAIALGLRQAVQAGKTAALITPDRTLSRRVTAALDRWGILPDDSAGLPLALSAPGRLFRHVTDAMGVRLTAEALLVVLKHPLVATGLGKDARGEHLRRARDLELHLRRHGPAYPTGQDLRDWAVKAKAPAWGIWIGGIVDDLPADADGLIAEHLTRHVSLTRRLAGGPDSDNDGELFKEGAGRAARKVCDTLERDADAGGTFGLRDYANLFNALLNEQEVRNPDEPDPRVLIWGTLEARVGGTDLVILGGMNDGTWPETPKPDPWLNRAMRVETGLLLPERRIGLSAHDYQQAACAPEVWIARARRSSDAETVPSRWINRLTNLLGGLPDQHGPDALMAMRARGEIWLAQADAIAAPVSDVDKAQRPSPRPPVDARPKEISVTQVKTLIRDPYATYAAKVLRLRELDPLLASADAPLRGVIFHEILERFISEKPDASDPAAFARLMEIAQTVLTDECPWPTVRLQWLTKLDQLAGPFLAAEVQRQAIGTLLDTESWGEIIVTGPDVRLTCKADRIDADPQGAALIYDYKTGAVPTKPQQESFDKQLLLESAMVERGAFKDIGIRPVAHAAFLGIGPKMQTIPAPLDKLPTDQVWAEFTELLTRWADPSRGYSARIAMFSRTDYSPYDHLSRFGEWSISDPAMPEDLT
jgi:ATP-dependent helicase/nuclease subunit B